MKKAFLIRSGKFKKLPNSPTRSDGKLHEYCPPNKVEEQMLSLLDFYKNYAKENLCPFLLAAFLHHRYTQIHPFQDGNGRVARTISSIPLLIAGLPPIIVKATNKADYILALQKADFENDLIPLMEVFGKNLLSACEFVLNMQN